jgi:serine/threonine protein kinase
MNPVVNPVVKPPIADPVVNPIVYQKDRMTGLPKCIIINPQTTITLFSKKDKRNIISDRGRYLIRLGFLTEKKQACNVAVAVAKAGSELLIRYANFYTRSIMKLQDVPHIVPYYGAFGCKDRHYVVMPFFSEGDLYSRLFSLELKPPVPFFDQMFIAKQLLVGLSSIHSKNICHRDLRSENIFVKTKYHSGYDNTHIYIGGFGICAPNCNDQTELNKPVSPISIYSPELVRRAAGDTTIDLTNKIDIWALGIIFHYMIFPNTLLPFHFKLSLISKVEELKQTETKEKILTLMQEVFDQYPTDQLVQRVIKKMFNPNPKQRPSAPEIYRDLFKKIG